MRKIRHISEKALQRMAFNKNGHFHYFAKIVAMEKTIFLDVGNSFNLKIKKERSFNQYSVACNNG